MTDSKTNDAGFSLLEVLTSLLIVALIATSGATILLRIVDSRESLERQSVRTEALQRVHALMREDFAQWVPRDFRPRENLDRLTRFSGGDSLERGHLFSFVRDGWTNPTFKEDRSGLIVVRYLVEDDKLIRKVRLAPSGVTGTEGLETVLLTGLKDYQLEFREGLNWVTQLQVRAGEGGTAPPAVKLSLEMADGRSFEWLFLTPAEAGVS